MGFRINFNEEKNQLLIVTRGIGFEQVIIAIKDGKLLDDIHHPKKKYSKLKIYDVLIEEYVYAVPYVLNKDKDEIFLKTIYPSRVLTKKYRKGEKHGKTKNK